MQKGELRLCVGSVVDGRGESASVRGESSLDRVLLEPSTMRCAQATPVKLYPGGEVGRPYLSHAKHAKPGARTGACDRAPANVLPDAGVVESNASSARMNNGTKHNTPCEDARRILVPTLFPVPPVRLDTCAITTRRVAAHRIGAASQGVAARWRCAVADGRRQIKIPIVDDLRQS